MNKKIAITVCIIAASVIVSGFIYFKDRIIRPEITNVKEQWKAIGDGKADDSGSIQAAIDSLKEGGIVYFPEGVYLIKKTIILKDNITLSLDDNAVIRNGKNGNPSMMFMNAPYQSTKSHGAGNITISGGTIDMNGGFGTSTFHRPEALPLVSSTSGFGFAYASNITIENLTMKDSFNGHAIQLADVHNVMIRNCRFLGQTHTEKVDTTKEYIQIEPGSVKGFPYILAETKKPSYNITIENSYFGKSDASPEIATFIGTHSEIDEAQCYNIKIRNNTFDNPYYSGIRFCGYKDVSITGNTFIANDGDFDDRNLVSIYLYKDTTMPVSSGIKIDKNRFEISDKKTTAIRAAGSVEGVNRLRDIKITGNTITTGFGSPDGYKGIYTYRVDNCTIANNKIQND